MAALDLNCLTKRRRRCSITEDAMATTYDRRGIHGGRGPSEEELDEAYDKLALELQRRKQMHYRNGREAKNGDKIVQIGGYGDRAVIVAVGVLYDAKPGNDFCNGNIAPVQSTTTGACLCDCLHVDDLAELLKKAGLDKRPAGK